METKDGLHIWEDHFYPEVINPETGEVVADGEMGELVFTTLTKEGLPMVRYRTRDLTRLLPGTARSMRRMEKITGRSDDMIILRGVNVFPSQVEELVLDIEDLAPYFQIELTKEKAMDKMTVLAEPSPNHVDASQQLGDLLKKRIKDTIGVSATVKVGAPGSVERSEGKARRVVDHRPKG